MVILLSHLLQPKKDDVMDDKRSSLSVKEIESFAKKNRFQVAMALAILLATLFSFFLSMLGLSVFGVGIGGILGVFFYSKAEAASKKIFQFVTKQEQTTQLVLAAVFLIVSIFLPPLVMFLVGLHGGKDLRATSNQAAPLDH